MEKRFNSYRFWKGKGKKNINFKIMELEPTLADDQGRCNSKP